MYDFLLSCNFAFVENFSDGRLTGIFRRWCQIMGSSQAFAGVDRTHQRKGNRI
jgi:hypothetical protein